MDRIMEIINATLELAAENGLGTVSMQQIADKIGITKASLYNHYSSREQIVDAMYEYLREASKQRAGIGDVDYDELFDGRSLRDILYGAVENYRRISTDPQMFLFYKVIMSEWSINSTAAARVSRFKVSTCSRQLTVRPMTARSGLHILWRVSALVAVW